MKRRNGDYIAPFAPHGCIKDPKGKHKIIVDEEAAEAVKQIFSLFPGGMNKNAIVLYLNEHGMETTMILLSSHRPSVKSVAANKGRPVRTTGG